MEADREPTAGGVNASSAGFRWTATLLLGAAGLLLNLLAVPLSPGTDLIFGGVASLLAAVALGPVHGLLAAATASARTLWLWNHPWAWLIFSAEAAVVGLLVQRRGWRPLVAELAYWSAVGIPLLFLTYHLILGVQGTTFTMLALKQTLNGLMNAVLVEMLLLLPVVRRMLRVRGPPRLQSALAVVVVTAGVVPALAFGIWVGQREWARNVERTRDRVLLFSQAYASKLEQYVQLHERAVASVAEASERRGEFRPDQLQRLVSGALEEFPGFVNLYAADSRGITVAFAPPSGASGQSLIGLSFSDRDYFQRVRRTREGVISDVFAGRGGATEPLIVMAQPILQADTFAGYVLGALDLNRLPPPAPLPAADERLRVVDARGMLISDTRRPYRSGEQPRTLADSAMFGVLRQVTGSSTALYQAPGARTVAKVAATQVLVGITRLPSLGWWVWVEQPFSSIQSFVAEAYVRLFALLIGMVLLSLSASTYLARYLSSPLLRLRGTAGALAAGNLTARVGVLPAATPTEIRELGSGFDDMAAALAGHTEELEELGEIARSLASTLQLEELLHRITDAAVRLVDPDGCGIALLSDDGQSLQAADYSIGLLGTSAGRQIPAQSSVVGWVARTGQSVLISDAATDERVFAGYIDPVQVRSVICAPLIGRSGALGSLVAVRARSNPEEFTGADLRLLERLAGYAAVAVENARLLEAAEAASRAKSDFIATMSHELRTPLNAVLGHLELLEMGIHGSLNREQLVALRRVQTATRHLRGLIEEVLSFSRLEAGRVEVVLAETDLCAIVAEVGSVVEPLALEKGLRFDASCNGADALPVVTDADKIRQILINLTGNAVKFTDQGHVAIELQQRGAEAVVTVRDTGVGIPEQDRERLFRPFEQLETGLSRPHGGTGLGLYLSGRYAALIGGRIDVRSKPGQGSEFSLVLPIAGPEGDREGSTSTSMRYGVRST